MQQKGGRDSPEVFFSQILKMFNFLNYFNLLGSDPSILAYRWDNPRLGSRNVSKEGGGGANYLNSRYKRILTKQIYK